MLAGVSVQDPSPNGESQRLILSSYLKCDRVLATTFLALCLLRFCSPVSPAMPMIVRSNRVYSTRLVLPEQPEALGAVRL